MPKAKKKTKVQDTFADLPEFLVLSDRQRDFVLEYLKTGVRYKSYMVAYGIEDDAVAAAAATRLLKVVKVLKAVNAAKRLTGAVVEKKYSISRRYLLGKLSERAEVTADDYVKINPDGTVKIKKPKGGRGLKSIGYSESYNEHGKSVSFSLSVHDSVKALETLAKMTGALEPEHGDQVQSEPLKGRASQLAAKYRGSK